MKIQERLKFKSPETLITLKPDQKVFDAVSIMSKKNIGSVLIVDEDEAPVGILTERDLMTRVLNNGLDAQLTNLEEVMTKHIKIARAEDDALEWMRQMSNDRFRHLPVVDEDGKAIAILSQGDFMSYSWPELMKNVKESVKMIALSNQQLILILGSMLIYGLGLTIILNL